MKAAIRYAYSNCGQTVRIFNEMSMAWTECVKAPQEMYVTPVAAIWRTVFNVTLPDASVGTAPPMSSTADLRRETSIPPATQEGSARCADRIVHIA